MKPYNLLFFNKNLAKSNETPVIPILTPSTSTIIAVESIRSSNLGTLFIYSSVTSWIFIGKSSGNV